LIISLLSVGLNFASAASGDSVTVGTVNGVTPGGTVEVPVTITITSENYVMLSLTYSQYFTYIEHTGDSVTDLDPPATGTGDLESGYQNTFFTFSNDESPLSGGTYNLILKFSVASNAPDGLYPITDLGNGGLTLNGEDYDSYSFTAGSITIGSASPLYTVTADSTVTEIEAGESFNVDVKLAANPAVENWASLEAYLRYDGARVAPGDGVLPYDQGGVMISQENDGQVKLYISREGGATAVGPDGVSVVSIPFTAIAEGVDVEFKIENAKVSVTGQTGMTDATAGPAHKVTITAAQTPAPITFDTDFAGAPDGYKLLKYALDAKPAVQYTYGGETMHYANIDGSHYVTYIVANSVTADNAVAIVQTGISAEEFDGDLNGDGDLEIVDAQIAYDLATGVHDDDDAFVKLSVAQRLSADVDADGDVDADDAHAIQYKLHFGSFGAGL
jgi:hypothetical protein